MRLPDRISDTVKKLASKKSRLFVTVLALMVFLFISAMVIAVVQIPKKHKRTVVIPTAGRYVQTRELLAPAESTLTEDHYFSRIPEDRWTQEETDRYFTLPDESGLEKLRNSNKEIIDSIIGAAP